MLPFRILITGTLLMLLARLPAAVGAPGQDAPRPTAPAASEPPSSVLPVETHESAANVRLRIRFPVAIEPDSVELELKGRAVVVRARSTEGADLASGVILLTDAPTEAGAEAKLEEDDLLVVTLQKKHIAP